MMSSGRFHGGGGVASGGADGAGSTGEDAGGKDTGGAAMTGDTASAALGWQEVISKQRAEAITKSIEDRQLMLFYRRRKRICAIPTLQIKTFFPRLCYNESCVTTVQGTKSQR
jgi:hypothetical protein